MNQNEEREFVCDLKAIPDEESEQHIAETEKSIEAGKEEKEI